MTSVNLILLLIMNFFFRAFPLSPHRCAFQLSSHRYMNHKRPKNSWYPFPSRIFSSLPSDNHHFSLRLTIETAEDMEEIGAMLSVLARPPDVLFLDGDLGAGKTTFARGFVLYKLGSDSSREEIRITSPTYLLSNTYKYPAESTVASSSNPFVELHHMDLYRLPGTNSSDFDPLQLDHVFKKCISLIEWPIRLFPFTELMPSDEHRLDIDITIVPQSDTRLMTLTAPVGSTWKERIKNVVDEGMLDDLIVDE